MKNEVESLITYLFFILSISFQVLSAAVVESPDKVTSAAAAHGRLAAALTRLTRRDE